MMACRHIKTNNSTARTQQNQPNAAPRGRLRPSIFFLALLLCMVCVGCAGTGKPQAPAKGDAAGIASPVPQAIDKTPEKTPPAPALPPPPKGPSKQEQVLAAIRSMVRLGGEGTGHLSQLAQSPDKDIRFASVETLGRIPDVRSVPYLIQALKDPYHRVREVAVLGLIRLEDQLNREHVDQLLEMVRNGEESWPDPASEYTITVNHYAGAVLTRVRSIFVSPEIAAEADEAMMRY